MAGNENLCKHLPDYLAQDENNVPQKNHGIWFDPLALKDNTTESKYRFLRDSTYTYDRIVFPISVVPTQLGWP
jgi:hypothetical protein